jgi:hypothetical protein
VAGEESALLDELLRVLEQTIPFDAIYLDMASEVRPTTPEADDEHESLRTLAERILDSLGRTTPAGQRFLSSLAVIEPFSAYPDEAKTIVRELSNGQ